MWRILSHGRAVLPNRRAESRKRSGYERHPVTYGTRLARNIACSFFGLWLSCRIAHCPIFRKKRMFSVKVTVKQLAELVQGQVQGDGDLVISAARPLQEAAAGDITYI